MLHKYFHVSSYLGLTEQRLLTTYVKDDWRKRTNLGSFWEIYRQSSLEPFLYIPGVVNLETFSLQRVCIYIPEQTSISFYLWRDRCASHLIWASSFIVLGLLSCDTYPAIHRVDICFYPFILWWFGWSMGTGTRYCVNRKSGFSHKKLLIVSLCVTYNV